MLLAVVRSLNEKKKEKLSICEAMVSLAQKEKRELSEAENKEFDSLMAECHELSLQATRYEKLHNEQQALLGKLPTNAQIPVEIPTQHTGKLSCFFDANGTPQPKLAYQFGVFLAATVYKNPKYQRKLADMGYSMESLAMGTGNAIVPEEWAGPIINLRNKYGVFRRNAAYRSMSGGTSNQPVESGGLTAYWIDENAAITESNKTWTRVQLVAKKLAGLTRYSRELDEDAIINMGDTVAANFAYAFARAEDLAGFLGDGTGTYGSISGILPLLNDGSHDGSLILAAATHTTVNTLTVPDFVSAIAYLPEYALPFAKWYCSGYTYAQGMLRLGQQGGGTNVLSIREGLEKYFMGYPVETTEVLPTAGMAASAIPILFGALNLSSVLGERKGIEIDTSEHRYFEYDQIGMRAVERIDIKNHSLGTDTVPGPVIALKLPAA